MATSKHTAKRKAKAKRYGESKTRRGFWGEVISGHSCKGCGGQLNACKCRERNAIKKATKNKQNV